MLLCMCLPDALSDRQPTHKRQPKPSFGQHSHFSLPPEGRRRTCWLIRTIPMSLRSVVNRSKAASMAELSVLLSTTKKFFCASGPGVTCYGLLAT